MIKEKITIEKEKRILEKWDKLLEMEEIDFDKEGFAQDTILDIFTAIFSDGVEADIKICSGISNLFVDPVLFDKNGYEIGLLDPEGNIEDIFIFETDKKEYIVEIVGI